MATEIIEKKSDNKIFLHVSGELFVEDARLISNIVLQTLDSGKNQVVLDLADLSLMDSDAAAILRQMATENKVEIIGTELFLQNAIDAVERQDI
ncbi:MAG TPA: STAS domain-containing protein [Pyrinomonadaceae bacterium]|jgi:anti-anti-sigma factor|nr:STAS domain-containing protein [Pyrinomonadaceae bacterium]